MVVHKLRKIDVTTHHTPTEFPAFTAARSGAALLQKKLSVA
jgi:hypothetical protein